MKFYDIKTLITCLLFVLMYSSNSSAFGVKKSLSYLKIDILEASNLHCLLNQDFHCNPYASIEFKHSKNTYTTEPINCTKSPQWESSFEITPEVCNEVIYINFYQFLNPTNMNFLNGQIEGEDYEEGNIKMGFLGRVVLELEKLPFKTIDDWFMVESPAENDRITFPACVHLSISWTSTICKENKESLYQIDSIKPTKGKDWVPSNYIPMCKRDFAIIYKNLFTGINETYPLTQRNELTNDKCIEDPMVDYGFKHSKSNLTDIEEHLVYKIVKRTIGEDVVFSDIGKPKNDNLIKEYKEFFEKDCYNKEDLSIKRINLMLQNEVENMPKKTTNPYVNREEEEFVNDYPMKLARKRLDTVFNDTLNQFFTIESSKNLDNMDDENYLKTINEMVRKTFEMSNQNKVDDTLFEQQNKIILSKTGRVTKQESHFFTIYSLYKWNGGKFDYDTIRREYLLRRKDFECYERVIKVQTNIYFNFLDNECPLNSLCVDPNGIVINSKTDDPRLVFADEIASKSIKFRKAKNENEVNSFNFKQTQDENGSFPPEDYDEGKVNDILNFEKLVNSELNTTPVPIDSFKDVLDDKLSSDDISTYFNKFDVNYMKRQKRIYKKKEIIINRIFDLVYLLGEVLALANINIIKNPGVVNESFIRRENILLKKYLLIWESNNIFLEKSAKVLFDLIMCNTDQNNLRYLLNELMEGMCRNDDKAMKILSEIVVTLVIDTLLKTNYFQKEDLQAKYALVTVFNKKFCFKTITKIRFLDEMFLIDFVKEKIAFIILENDSNEKSKLISFNS